MMEAQRKVRLNTRRQISEVCDFHCIFYPTLYVRFKVLSSGVDEDSSFRRSYAMSTGKCNYRRVEEV